MAAYDPANPYQSSQSPYDAQRNKAVTDAQAAGQASTDAITRRYAAMGNLNSGSYTQALADQGRATQQQQEGALGGINAQETQNAIPFQQQQIQNQFAQQMQGGQFAHDTSMQQGLFGQQSALQGQQLGQQESQFEKTLPLQQQALTLQQQGLNQDFGANQQNYSLAQQQLARSGGLFGGGGAFGLGMGGNNGDPTGLSMVGINVGGGGK